VGRYILLRHFMDSRIERSEWTGEETGLRRGAYFPDPSVESEWIVTKPPHLVEGEHRLVFVVEQIKLPIAG
jgi:hypothetical protein